MKKAIIIPVYLRLKRPDELLDLEGVRLAMRAIQSLGILEDQDFTLILPVCFDLMDGGRGGLFIEMQREMDSLFRKEIRTLGLGKTLIFSSHHLDPLRKYLEQKGFKTFCSLIDLTGFSKIRNTGLLLAQALSMDVAIFLDYDEVVENSNYLKIACEYLNQKWKGRWVVGKGGFYVNPNGAILLPPQRLWWRLLWNKTKWMNRVWETILSSKDRLVSSPMLLGGNLVLLRQLFQSIPFDPYIPRGEDTDYLINASQSGYCLLFDKLLRIKHLHTERTKIYFHEELKGDIERFIYERRKIRRGLDMNLDPYPGYFLKWTLYPKIVLTSLFLSLDYMGRKDWRRAKEGLMNIGFLFQKKKAGPLDYLRFKKEWERVMERVQKEGMGDFLENCWG